MRNTINNRQRHTIALALCAVFIIIVLANWWVSYSMTQVSKQFESVYQDRLVPALDITAMQERFYQNRMLLEEHLQAEAPARQQQLEKELQQHMREIDSLAAKFEATYLTNQESKDLKRYKRAVRRLSVVQLQVLKQSRAGNKDAATGIYKADVVPAFNELLLPIHALSQLQQDVGHELYASAEQQLNTLKMLSYLVIALAVILALLLGVVLQHNRHRIRIKPQQFHLN